MLRPNGWIIQASGNGVCVGNLAMSILQDVRVCPLQYARRATTKARSMIAKLVAASSSLNANQFYPLITDEFVKDANSVGSTADAGNHSGGQPPFSFQDLRARLTSYNGVEIPHHGGIRMSAQHASQQIMRGTDIGDPVAHGLIDCIFERARAGFNSTHLRAQQSHAKNIQFLAAHVLNAHIDHAVKTKQRANCCRGHSMLSGASLSNDALLVHTLPQQRLYQPVIDLVR